MTDDDTTQLICIGPFCACSGSEEECSCDTSEAGSTCTACDAVLKRIYIESGEDVVS